MKKIFLLIALSLSFVNGWSQNLSSTIKKQGLEMARAIVARDADKLIQYLHPKTIELAGGKEKILAARDTANKYMTQFGATIKKIVIGNPDSIVQYKGQLQAVVPQTTELSFFDNTVVVETSLIALSDDKGKTWKFIDNSMYNVKKMGNKLPEISPALVIPPMHPPKFIDNKTKKPIQ